MLEFLSAELEDLLDVLVIVEPSFDISQRPRDTLGATELAAGISRRAASRLVHITPRTLLHEITVTPDTRAEPPASRAARLAAGMDDAVSGTPLEELSVDQDHKDWASLIPLFGARDGDLLIAVDADEIPRAALVAAFAACTGWEHHTADEIKPFTGSHRRHPPEAVSIGMDEFLYNFGYDRGSDQLLGTMSVVRVADRSAIPRGTACGQPHATLPNNTAAAACPLLFTDNVMHLTSRSLMRPLSVATGDATKAAIAAMCPSVAAPPTTASGGVAISPLAAVLGAGPVAWEGWGMNSVSAMRYYGPHGPKPRDETCKGVAIRTPGHDVHRKVFVSGGWHCTFCYRYASDYIFKMRTYGHKDRYVHVQRPMSEAEGLAAARELACNGHDPARRLPEVHSFQELLTIGGPRPLMESASHAPRTLTRDPARFSYLLPGGCEHLVPTRPGYEYMWVY